MAIKFGKAVDRIPGGQNRGRGEGETGKFASELLDMFLAHIESVAGTKNEITEGHPVPVTDGLGDLLPSSVSLAFNRKAQEGNHNVYAKVSRYDASGNVVTVETETRAGEKTDSPGVLWLCVGTKPPRKRRGSGTDSDDTASDDGTPSDAE